MQGKWKVSQNQPEINRASVASELTQLGSETGTATARLVHLP